MADSRSLFEECVSFRTDLATQLTNAAVFITGASGFLAANLICYLTELRRQAAASLDVAASARRTADDVPLFQFLSIPPPALWTVASVEATVIPRGRRWVVVHTASYASPTDYMRNRMATYEANTRGVLNLFEQLDSENCEHFVYFSSAEVYGQPPASVIPTPEEFTGGPRLDDPRSIYGESKRMAEVLAVTLGIEKNIPVTVIRPWNVYGPGQRVKDGRVPIDFFDQLYSSQRIVLKSDGTPTRSLCHAWEAMPQIAVVLAPPRTGSTSQAYNIGKMGAEISIRHLAEKCAALCGLSSRAVSVTENPGASALQRCEPDTRKVLHVLEDRVRCIDLDEGLQTVNEWTRWNGTK